MTGERPHRILRPASAAFMTLTVALALLFNLLPWRDVRGIPDLVALVLVFWCIHQPRRTGIGIAWLLGLLIDAGNGTLLGQHALAYSVLAFGAMALHRRILWFPLWQQAAHVLVLLLVGQSLEVAVRLATGGAFPGFFYFAGSLIAAALWPAATFVLLMPQRRPEDVDLNRPI
ncbi:MAG: rod shape-determining protein MreD [Betaproteobacteria bacterium]|nr:rod shape-determining protein MreD [Betaproteobacteria bacterium]